MSFRRVKGLLLACAGAGAVMAAVSDANAGGFAVREQSAYGQGSSFAGIAAGGSLSAMYWNPAVITQTPGMGFETVVSLIMPDVTQSYTTSSLAAPPIGTLFPAYKNDVANSGEPAAVPAFYTSYQLNERLWIGMSVNAPFGLTVGFPTQWAGSTYGADATVASYNFSPTIAYKINDMISVAAGVQIQYMRVNYAAAIPPTTNQAIIGGDGYGYGFTLGATITPMRGTTIGIGYRSAIDQDIVGTLTGPTLPATTYGSVSTSIALPDMITVGLRQRLTDRLTAMAGFEWTNWSRIGTSTVTTPSGATATVAGTAVQLPFNYSDGYYYSLGAEYIVDPSLTVRAGIAYEQSPITDDVRTPRLPDNDRWWYSAGATYKLRDFPGFSFDVGYSFVDVKDTPLNLGPTTGNPWSPPSPTTQTYVGTASSQIHIVSVGVKYQWGAPKLIK
jgi:long-chain fatty acid transport protein